MYNFKLERETTPEELRPIVAEIVFENPENFLNHYIFIMLAPRGCYTLMTNNKIKWEKSPGGEVVTKIMETDEEMIEVITTTFPSIPEEVVRKGMKNWRKRREGKPEIPEKDDIV